MRWARPKSLSGLMLLGLAVIAVPLLVALGDAELQIRALADTGQQLVVDGVTAARASQELFAQISSLERTARLYQVLNDPKLLDLYRSQDSRLSATRAELGRNARTDQVRVRYQGMSWITGGTLRLLGTSQSATLSGRVSVDRLLLADNFDFASLVSSSPEAVVAGGQVGHNLH